MPPVAVLSVETYWTATGTVPIRPNPGFTLGLLCVSLGRISTPTYWRVAGQQEIYWTQFNKR